MTEIFTINISDYIRKEMSKNITNEIESENNQKKSELIKSIWHEEYIHEEFSKLIRPFVTNFANKILKKYGQQFVHKLPHTENKRSAIAEWEYLIIRFLMSHWIEHTKQKKDLFGTQQEEIIRLIDELWDQYGENIYRNITNEIDCENFNKEKH
jgi:hypothetical protein